MNTKAVALGIVGLLLFSVNLAVISPMVMEITEDALGTATVMDNETWEDEEWLVSVSQRSFYAWNLTNAAELQDGAADDMEFEKVGPFTYNLTTKRDLDCSVCGHNEDTGILTYREYNVYEWAEGLSGDTQLTNINILFNAQKVGAIGTAIDTGAQFVRGAFTTDMLYVDLSERAPSIWVSDDLTGIDMSATLPSFDSAALDQVMNAARDPADSSICIAMTCDIGPMLMVRLGVPDNGTGSIERATLFGYVGANDAETFARDNELYNEISTRFSNHGGGAVLESASMDDLNDRLEEMTGERIEDETTLQNLLFSGNDGNPTGLLKCDSQNILCGSTDFLMKANDDPFALKIELTVNPEQYTFPFWALQSIGGWAGDWFLSTANYEMILSGGNGKINADEWFYESFGSVDPINNEYITLGLNVGTDIGPLWSTVYGNQLIDLDAEVTEGLFNGAHSISGDFAMDFMYGEMTGFSVPMDENYIPTAGGTVHVWDDAFVGELYNLDNNSASALRWLFSYTVFDQFLDPLLESFLDVTPYKTQSVNNWLFGWDDPLSGWVSLEKNATYYGCQYDQNIEDGFGTDCWTDSASVYSVFTGAVGNHEPGQLLFEDYGEYLPWRTPARNQSAYGMLEPVNQSGVVSSYFPANQPARSNLGGYVVATSEVTGMGSVLGIETYTHKFTLDPLDNPIQAKLLGQENILDVFPGALPVYFGGEVTMQMEPNVNAAIAGDLESYFYLDTRDMSVIGTSEPTMGDLQKVFQISQNSSLTETQSEDFKNVVITNTQPYSYWTNFDTNADSMYIDQITMAIWVLGIVCLLGCSVVAKIGRNDEREIDWSEEE